MSEELDPIHALAAKHGSRYVNRHFPEKCSYGFTQEGLRAFADAVLAEHMNERANAAGGVGPEPCPACGEGQARLFMLRQCDTCKAEYAGEYETRFNFYVARKENP